MKFKLSTITILLSLSSSFALANTNGFGAVSSWDIKQAQKLTETNTTNDKMALKNAGAAWGAKPINQIDMNKAFSNIKPEDRLSSVNPFLTNKSFNEHNHYENYAGMDDGFLINENQRRKYNVKSQENKQGFVEANILKQQMDTISRANARGGSQANLQSKDSRWKNSFDQINKMNDQFNPKFDSEELSAGRALMCLLAGRVISECRPDFKKYLKKLYNPKKYGSAVAFLNKSPTRSGRSKGLEDQYFNQFNDNNINVKSYDWGRTYDKKRNDSFMKYYNVNSPYDFKWKNKHNKFVGTVNLDGERYPSHAFTCDVEPETGLNSRMETRVEYYYDDHERKERYYLKTLTEMPQLCSAKKYHYPTTTVLPVYDTKKCNPNTWYRAEDYLRGYVLVEKHNRRRFNDQPEYTQVPIEKNCWYIPEGAFDRLQEKFMQDMEKIRNNAVNTMEHPDITNSKMFNLTVPNEFKIPQKLMDSVKKDNVKINNPFLNNKK